MDLSQLALPGGLTIAGIGAVATTGMVLGHRRRSSEQTATTEERDQLALQRRQSWQRRLAVTSLAVGCLMMFVLAGIAAWLSFGAQREYAHAHNGGDWDAATLFAMLLDAGALSLSLIRFFEALSLRSSGITRLLLFAFVAASAQMNLLHAPEAGFSGAFLAVVPPLEYAVLLEMLLFKIEQVIMGRQKRRRGDEERGYSLLLWLPWPIGSPVRMWKAWRKELLATVDNVRVTGSRHVLVPSTGDEPAPVPASGPPVAADLPDPPAVPARQSGGTADVLAARDAGTRRPAAGEGSAAVPVTQQPALPGPLKPPAPPAERPAPAAQRPEPVTAAVPAAAAPAAPPPVHPQSGARAEEEESQTAGGDIRDEEPDARDEKAAPPDGRSGRGGSHPEPGDDGEADDEGDGYEDEIQAEHGRPAPGAGDGDVRERQRAQIDLSALPKDEKPRQLAERIYLAHQLAGLALDKADLGRWARYKNPRSGHNEYLRLEKQYGPIIEKEGAGYLDLDWSVQPADTAQAA
ncbi:MULTISPECIES: DUF2637 domain-containing protein [Streptomycetaceae]|uniref:DUF2637 domain-containing protein n=1 Tax=Streptomycetaceae TaxID=2062 RepID=UPI00288AADC3|nr:DUF2637 domain-containing protein [Streptomyces sp. ITFR-21]WNI20102.1 DUF2637 domain-containing protein [Streptomyces sp. ITFR-21]